MSSSMSIRGTGSFAGLRPGRSTSIAAGLSITPERALHVAFSQPYATGGTTLATNLETTSNVTSLDDLNDTFYTVAAIAGSAAEELARRLFPRAELELYEDADAAGSALVAGEVDAYLDNEPIPTFLALENPAIVDVAGSGSAAAHARRIRGRQGRPGLRQLP